MAWILAAIVVLTLGGTIATMVISARYDVAGGYIPPEQRAPR